MTPEIKTDLSESSNEIIKSLALPASKQIGKALGNAFGLLNTATLPIKLANNYAQRNFQIYNERIKNISDEKIKSVEPEIAIPIIEKLSYTSNEDLADAYANLLANASDIDKVNCIHPGFINKLNNMAPDEVKILQHIKDSNYEDIPYIIFKAENKREHLIRTISFKITSLVDTLNLNPKNITIHFNNLISLNIINDLEGHSLPNDSTYVCLFDKYRGIKEEYEQDVINGKYGLNMELVTEKSMFTLTTLGKTFIEACTKL